MSNAEMSSTISDKYCKHCKYESMVMCYHPINGLSEVSGTIYGLNCFMMRRGSCIAGKLYEPSKLTKVLKFFKLLD